MTYMKLHYVSSAVSNILCYIVQTQIKLTTFISFYLGYFVGPQFSMKKFKSFATPDYHRTLPSSPSRWIFPRFQLFSYTFKYFPMLSIIFPRSQIIFHGLKVLPILITTELGHHPHPGQVSFAFKCNVKLNFWGIFWLWKWLLLL